ncbi:MAG: MerC domain-containing protein [Planctomycetes bacterium]|nr:MerC domain-containing protein [Planctomycetota bacterium]
MINVELIYDNDCPNVEETRGRLKLALVEAGLQVQWQEWEWSDAKSPDYVRGYGSPTILVNGKDVAGVLPSDGAKCCRVYSDKSREISGVPSSEVITSALLKAKENTAYRRGAATSRTRRYRRILTVFPAIGTVLIPGVSCPLCWPAYAGLLSSVGLGFVNYTPYLFPLTVFCLAVAIFSLGFRARRGRGFGPLVLGSAAALIILTGKFIFVWKAVTYGGLILLVAASIWNLWSRRTAGGASCPDCVPAAVPQTELEHKQPRKEVSHER